MVSHKLFNIPGRVFVVGCGSFGQLGFGPKVHSREKLQQLDYFDSLEIVQVVAGGLHNIALSKHGQVFLTLFYGSYFLGDATMTEHLEERVKRPSQRRWKDLKVNFVFK